MNRTNIAFVVVTILLVGLAVLWEFRGLTSPGPLHPSHSQLAEFRGRNDCKICHGNNTVSLASACLDCHSVIDQQIKFDQGMHGQLDSIDVQECQLCHFEHTDGNVSLVSQVSFDLAGIPDLEQYTHEHIEDFALTDRHNIIACVQCHETVNQPRLDPGEFRFLGLDQTCTACHEDVHLGEFSTDCASCHGQSEPFDTVAQFEHTDEFTLTAPHAGLSCVSCHEADSAFSITNLQDSLQMRNRECADCHDSAHTSEFIQGVAKSLGVSKRMTCVECHTSGDQQFLYPVASMPVSLHAATGFSLDPPHDTQDCLECHTPTNSPSENGAVASTVATYSWANLNRHANDCRACHDDAHAGQFDAGGFMADCLSCHESTHFKPSTFDVARHQEAAFPLSEAHSVLSCAECHTATDDGVTQYMGTPTSCAVCHEDPHAGQFVISASSDCSSCHGEAHFEPTLFDQAQHATTRFPLLGSHEAVGCRECHVVENGARQFVDTSMRCDSCHEDVHNGTFDGIDRPQVVDGKLGCARCHTSESFSAVQWTGDTHAQWTDFALVGSHSQIACTKCHSPLRRAGSPELTFQTASKDCASCHQDPHAGQFNLNGIVADCARCHSSEGTFHELVFDHQSDTQFPLDEAHVDLSCSKCHRPEMAGEFSIVRYRPLAQECRDCHGFAVAVPNPDD